MSLAVVGLSHHTAPLDVREQLVFTPQQAERAMLELKSTGAAAEAVILSTCNRTELYFVEPVSEDASAAERDAAASASRDAAEVLLAERAGTAPETLREYLYHHRARAAAAHLFRVVTSLDSMVLGEAQIQGQVKAAYELAASLQSPMTGPILSRLFQTALSVGGRVRNETALGMGAASVPAAAVELAKKIFGSLKGRRALVLGAGEMSELALTALTGEGVEGVVVVNRSPQRAQELAEKVGGEAVPYDALGDMLGAADIVATATSAPHAVITRQLMAKALSGGARNPLLILDIALPRDVEPAVGELDNVFLYDIDDLTQIVDENLERRKSELPEAERMVSATVDDFWGWYTSLEVVPLIRALRGRAESLRRVELEKAFRRMQHLSPEDREAVEVLTKQLLNKVLHQPTVRLREAASNGKGPGVVEAARYLFQIDLGDIKESHDE
ncbi:MAG: glutamyl-tRNA reductase [Gemmatimonadota bacterium]|jgi:glutamyl-tRNA reductase